MRRPILSLPLTETVASSRHNTIGVASVEQQPRVIIRFTDQDRTGRTCLCAYQNMKVSRTLFVALFCSGLILPRYTSPNIPVFRIQQQQPHSSTANNKPFSHPAPLHLIQPPSAISLLCALRGPYTLYLVHQLRNSTLALALLRRSLRRRLGWQHVFLRLGPQSP